MKFDLVERSIVFAKDVRAFIRALPYEMDTAEDAKQLVRSSGSIGANYIEANESLSKKDFLMRLKISRKEAKETMFWLEVMTVPEGKKEQCQTLKQEAKELVLILNAIIQKSL